MTVSPSSGNSRLTVTLNYLASPTLHTKKKKKKKKNLEIHIFHEMF